MSISQPNISRCLAKYHKHGVIMHLGNNGRPESLCSDTKAFILKIINKTPKISLRKVARTVESTLKKRVSHMTIKRFLNERSLFAYSPRRKPLLTPRHISIRWEMATLWLGLTDEEIKRIVFSDETKFNLRYSDGKVSVWRTPGSEPQSKHIEPTVKYFGGSVMVWGCFSYSGVGKLVFIEDTMDAPLSVTILASALPCSLAEMGLSDFIFQQDNDPKHTAKLTKSFFGNRDIKVLPWPPQSPDMNPIENLWDYVKEQVAGFQPKNIKDLKAAIIRAWSEISVETCRKYAFSFRKRSIALWHAHGKHTKY